MRELPFSPCGRRCREATDEGSKARSAAHGAGGAPPHPTCFAGHLLPQGEKESESVGSRGWLPRLVTVIRRLLTLAAPFALFLQGLGDLSRHVALVVLGQHLLGD